jgi:hypothetical protein
MPEIETRAIGPKPTVTVATIDRILAHAARHPVVYLPSHDPESITRRGTKTWRSEPKLGHGQTDATQPRRRRDLAEGATV